MQEGEKENRTEGLLLVLASVIGEEGRKVLLTVERARVNKYSSRLSPKYQVGEVAKIRRGSKVFLHFEDKEATGFEIFSGYRILLERLQRWLGLLFAQCVEGKKTRKRPVSPAG